MYEGVADTMAEEAPIPARPRPIMQASKELEEKAEEQNANKPSGILTRAYSYRGMPI